MLAALPTSQDICDYTQNHVFRLHELMQNVNSNGVENILVSQQCSGPELQGKQKFKATGNTTERYREFRTEVVKTGPRSVGASGSLIIWNPGPENNVEPLQDNVL